MSEEELYQRARARVQQLRILYTHASVFAFVNLWLLVINLLTNPQSLWFYWPLIGWGIALAAHAFVALGTGSSLAADWEERKIRELMARDAQRDKVIHSS